MKIRVLFSLILGLAFPGILAQPLNWHLPAPAFAADVDPLVGVWKGSWVPKG